MPGSEDAARPTGLIACGARLERVEKCCVELNKEEDMTDDRPAHRKTATFEPTESQQPMPLREICREHENEWLLVKILDTAASSGDGPCILLARGPDRNSLYKASRRVRENDREAVLEVLHGGTKWGREAAKALRDSIEQLKNRGEWVSVNPWWG